MEIIMVTVHDLAESLQFCKSHQAHHGCFCKHITSLQSKLQFVESFSFASCGIHCDCFSVRSQIHCNRSCRKGEYGGFWASSWQRWMAPTLEGWLIEVLVDSQGQSMEHFHQPWGEIKLDGDLRIGGMDFYQGKSGGRFGDSRVTIIMVTKWAVRHELVD